MTLTTNIAIGLLAIVAFAPWSAGAASLYGGATGDGTFSQAGIDVDASVGVSAGATGTPSAGSAGDDSSSNPGIEVEEEAAATDKDIAAHGEILRTKNAAVAHAEGTRKGETIVEYYHAGKLFGFMPVKVKAKTVVSADESGVVSIKTHMPWWNFLVSGTGETNKVVDGELTGSGAVSMDAKLPTAASKVRIMDAVVAAHARAVLMEETETSGSE